ncbi:Uncharacterised protein [Chromobacterium violaceum]|uniref:Uncharacterized protein n=1 Tax=Chromobacterium violaceum TaxID=536 RepID=A0A3S5DLU1_CHRVL|nr:Uncharacterised protein [Chromobacterium violaceum]
MVGMVLLQQEQGGQPRKIRKPPESVQAVISTLEPSAGSLPSFCISVGIITPMVAASIRFSVIAASITRPSDTLPYSSHATAPMTPPRPCR